MEHGGWKLERGDDGAYRGSYKGADILLRRSDDKLAVWRGTAKLEGLATTCVDIDLAEVLTMVQEEVDSWISAAAANDNGRVSE
jgi:hypothetical protein